MPTPKDPIKAAEMRKRLSLAHKRYWADPVRRAARMAKMKPLSIEQRAKMSATQKRIGNGPEEKKRRSERAKRLGYGKWMKDKKCHPSVIESNKTRKGKTYEEFYGLDRAQNEALKRKAGNRLRWEGVERKTFREHGSTFEYIEWRKAVFQRDLYICQRCGKRGGTLHAHHIKPWAKFESLRFEVLNGKTLCAKPCHIEEHKEMRMKEKMKLEEKGVN